MTHEEVAILWKDANGWDVRGYTNTLEDLGRFAKLVAAKEREALTNVATEDTSKERVDEMQKQRHEQEPVAFINVEERKLEWAKHMTWDTPTVVNIPKIPLYTTPPQRTWAGLTDEEIDHIYTGIRAVHHEIDSYVFARAIETKLKEKNSV
jgi:hypothetical protein